MTRHAMTMTLAIVAAATTLCGRSVAAQFPSAAGIQRQSHPIEISRSLTGSAPLLSADPINGARVAHGVLIGAGVGAVAGVVVAAVTPHSSHDEDALGYIAFGAIGAFVGMLVGGAIGATR